MKKIYSVILILLVLLTQFITIAVAANCNQTAINQKPLMDMSANDFYQGKDGGLYGGGNNTPSSDHLEKALLATNQVVPRNGNGEPDPTSGKIGFLSLGMSNTRQEFVQFMLEAEALKDPQVILVNGAQGGIVATTWASTEAPWNTVINEYLLESELSTEQVQVLWIKLANFATGQTPGLQAGGYTDRLRIAIREVVKKAKVKFPNLQIIYFSSRIYAGYASSILNPEPFAYESGFAHRLVIEDQIDGNNPNDNKDIGYVDDNGAPLPILLWGPYLWADGTTPRSDGLTWNCDSDPTSSLMDFESDGTHPSLSGEKKVAQKLIDFFISDITTSWFDNRSHTPPTGSSTLLGDIDKDGSVNILDYTLLSNSFGTLNTASDINQDGIVNILDFTILSNNFGASS